jgi:hypothetical protein
MKSRDDQTLLAIFAIIAILILAGAGWLYFGHTLADLWRKAWTPPPASLALIGNGLARG